MYFPEPQVRSLVVNLRQAFPGSELVFDAFSPFIVGANNLRMKLGRMGARYYWGLGRGSEVERWAEGIHLMGEWTPFSRREPRMAKYWWARNISLIGRIIVVYHFRLGPAAGRTIGP